MALTIKNLIDAFEMVEDKSTEIVVNLSSPNSKYYDWRSLKAVTLQSDANSTENYVVLDFYREPDDILKLVNIN